MKKGTKKGLLIGGIIATLFITLFLVLIYSIILDANSNRSLTINGTIVDVVHIGKSDNYIYGELFEITFDDNQTVIVESASCDGNLLDLSTGSHIVMKLWKDEPYHNWDIKQIVLINP